MTRETNDPILTAFQESLQRKLEGAFMINGVSALLPICSELEVYDHASGDTLLARVYATRQEHLESARAAWAQSGQVLPTLDLPHFCKSLGLIEVEGYLVHLTRFQAGITLADYLTRIGRMVPTTAIRFGVQLLHLLENLSRKGTHHGHLTPRDIIIGADGTPYIKNHGLWQLDLAIAKQLGVERLIDPAYLSPEHIQEKAIDVPAEVFNIGCLLHEMLTGQTPFHGNYEQVRDDQLNKPLGNPQMLNRDINVGLARVLVKAMAKNPAERFASLPDFAQTLAMLLPTAEWARYQQEAGHTKKPSDQEKEELNSQLTEAAQQAKGGDLDGAMHSVSAVLRMCEGYGPAIELADKIYNAQHRDTIKQALERAKQHYDNQQVDEALGELHQLLAIAPRHTEARQLQHDILEALQQQKPDLHRFVPVQLFMERAAVAKTLEQSQLAELLWTQVLLASPTADSSYVELLTTQKKLAKKELGALYGERQVPVQQTGKPGGGFGDDELEQLFAPLSQASTDASEVSEDQAPVEATAEPEHPHAIDPDAYDADMTVAEAEPIPKAGLPSEEVPETPDTIDAAGTPIAAEEVPASPGDSKPSMPEQLDDSFEAELASMEEDFDAEDLDEGPSQDFKTNEIEAQEVAKAEPESKDAFATRPLSDIETAPADPPVFPKNSENLATQRVDISAQEGHPVDDQAHSTQPISEQEQPAAEVKANTETKAEDEPWVAPAIPTPKVSEPEPPPENNVVVETPAKAAPKEPKSKMGLLIGIGAAAAIAIVVMGVMFYNASVRKAEFQNAARASYQEASTLESSGELEAALKAWETMQMEYPGFSDVNDRQAALEQRILERRNTLDRYLGRSRELISQGVLLSEDNENAAYYLKKIQEIDPENREAQAMLQEIGNAQMAAARELFENGDAEAARQVYADLLQVSVGFKNDMFEAEVDSFIEAKVVGPKLERLDRLIKAKKWEDAQELSDDLREQMSNTRLLDERWDAVANDAVAKLEDAEAKKRKKDMLAQLEILAMIRPDDPASYATRYNELSRDLNQAAINRLEKQVRDELKKKDYVRAGRFAYQLSKLDSENKLAESTLQEVRNTFRNEIKAQKQGNPRKALETYNQLIQVYNWRSYRNERKALQDRVNGFEKLLGQLKQQASGSYKDQIATVVRIQEQYNDFFNDPEFKKLNELKTTMEKEQKRLQALQSYVEKARDDSAVAYSDIVDRLKKEPAFQRSTGKQYVQQTLTHFEAKVNQYSGPVTLIIRRASNLPRASSGFNKDPEAYAVLEVNDKRFQTGVQRNARNPVWDYTCSFDATPDKPLKFSVYHDKGDGELLGSVTLDKVPQSGKGIEVKGKDGWSIFLDVRRKR